MRDLAGVRRLARRCERKKERAHLGLVLASGRTTLAKTVGESDEVARRSRDDERLATVVETDRDARVASLSDDVSVNLLDLLLERDEVETGDGEHGGGDTFTVLHRRGGERRRDGEGGEGRRALETDLEEDGEAVERVLVERLPGIRDACLLGRVGAGDDGGGDDSLRVARRSLELGAELVGAEVGALAKDDVLGELGEADEGKRHGAGGEVRG